MSLGARIKEERQRLGLTQTAFADLAGASRRAVVNWEGDGAAPLVTALHAWAMAGADAMYILTGKRADDRRADTLMDLRDQLARDRQRLADPDRGDSDEELATLCETVGNATRAMLNFDRPLMTPELVEEAEQLLAIVEKVETLRRYRIEQHKLLRASREQTRQRIASWFEGSEYVPNDRSLSMLVAIATEHDVPVRTLVDLVEELRADMVE